MRIKSLVALYLCFSIITEVHTKSLKAYSTLSSPSPTRYYPKEADVLDPSARPKVG